MPGNPFKKPFKGGNTRATPRKPQKPNPNRSNVPTPVSANGVKSKAIRQPKAGAVRVTSKARKSVSPAPVRQGAQMGTPGRAGSRPGAKPY